MGGDRAATTIGEIVASSDGSIKTGPFGTVLKANEYTRNGVPLISVGEIGYGVFRIHDTTPQVPPEVTSRLPEYILREGDIVFGRKGAVDRSARVSAEQDGWFLGSDGIRLRLPNTTDSRFISYHLQTEATRNWILQHATGTTMASLNQGVIERIPILLPPLDEQRAIANILGTIDDKIELNRQTNETLEAMARTLFKSWFVDFDPVRAKAEGRQPSGMDVETAKLFPSEFVESELGEIPKGWRDVPFLDFAELLSGGTPKTSVPEYWNGDIKWASAKDVSQCGAFFLVDTERMISREGLQHSATKMIPAGSVVVVARGATCGRFTVLAETMAMNQTCYALRPRVPGARWYLRFLSEQMLVRLVAQAHGSVFDTITTATFERMKTLNPGPQALERFETTVTPIVERIRQHHYESRTLARLRDALLPRLLSGELSVGGAERVLEAQA